MTSYYLGLTDQLLLRAVVREGQVEGIRCSSWQKNGLTKETSMKCRCHPISPSHPWAVKASPTFIPSLHLGKSYPFPNADSSAISDPFAHAEHIGKERWKGLHPKATLLLCYPKVHFVSHKSASHCAPRPLFAYMLPSLLDLEPCREEISF